MHLARLYETKYSDKCPILTRRSTKQNVFTPAVPFHIGPPKSVSNVVASKSLVQSPQVQSSVQQPLHGSAGNSQPFKRITFNEMQLRRAKGLCFNCDEKYSPAHKCPNKRLLLLQWGEDSISEDPVPTSDFTLEFDNSLSVEEPIIQQAVNTVATTVALTCKEEISTKHSLNAMNSAPVSGTMRFTGLVNGHQVQILLDGGSDDSFIQPRLAKFLHLDVQPSVPFKVMVGNGSALQVEDIVQNFQVQVQGHVLKIPVYLLSIEGAEIILGADWLSTLGPHVMNYKDLFIQFYVNDQFVTIYGDKKIRFTYGFYASIIQTVQIKRY